jgi:hypothetical protein
LLLNSLIHLYLWRTNQRAEPAIRTARQAVIASAFFGAPGHWPSAGRDIEYSIYTEARTADKAVAQP